MRSPNDSFYNFRADASALGGFLEEPFRRDIPTLAQVSLPPVGGFATTRSGAFNFEEVVSCSAAFTRISGQQHLSDGTIAIQVASVIEDLNILEVVTAKRISSQISITIPPAGGLWQTSLAGSNFEGLKVAGRDEERVRDIYQRESAATDPRKGIGTYLCSVLERFEGEQAISGRGLVVELPEFGRFVFGEVRRSRDCLQLTAIRADLGCPVKGKISICAVGGGGSGDNKS